MPWTLHALAFAALLLTPSSTGVAPPPAGGGVLVQERRPEVTQRTLAWLAANDAAGRKVWIYFTDKGIVDGAALDVALDEAASTLDAHESFRREKVLGARRVDFHDVPVREEYVARLGAAGLEVCRESRWLNAASVRGSLADLRRVGALPFVRAIVPVATHAPSGPAPGGTATGIPRQHVGDLFDYGTSRDQLDEIGVVEAHRLGYSGAGVVVAMLDTGFDWDQPAFAHIVADGRVLAQYDFVHGDGETHNEPGDDDGEHAHGTLTWSALAGLDEGELVGPAFGASFLLAKTEDITSETPIEEDNWIAAAEWADQNGADVISSSLIYKDWYDYPDMDGLTAPITIAADLAVGRGIVVCNAIGNDGTNDWYYMGAPADGFGVISVGATRADGSTADFSSHGPTFDGRIKPDVVARGDETYCAAPAEWGGGYLFVSGTSVACPLVAGAAALVLEAHPDWTPAEVRAALRSTADNAGAPDNDRGWGRIDVLAAIQ